MLELSPAQDSLARRPSQTPVALVVFTTWTDRASSSIETRHYWSNRDLIYPYDGTDREFLGILARGGRGVGAIVRRLGDLRPAPVTLAVVNDSTNGSSLWSILRSSKLYGATVEISVHYTGLPDGAPHPRSIPTADHTVRYRGEFMRASERDGVVTLEFDSPRPELLLREELGIDVAPKDFGRRWPYPIGHFTKVPALTVSAGAQSTLAQAIAIDHLGPVKISDGTRYPTAGAFSAWINGEEVACNRTGNTFNITARGQSGTRPAAHQAGDVVTEIAPIVLGIAPYQISEVTGLWVRLPSGDTVKLDASFSRDFSPTESTITISAAELRTVLAELFVSAAVTVQPAFVATIAP